MGLNFYKFVITSQDNQKITKIVKLVVLRGK